MKNKKLTVSFIYFFVISMMSIITVFSSCGAMKNAGGFGTSENDFFKCAIEIPEKKVLGSMHTIPFTIKCEAKQGKMGLSDLVLRYSVRVPKHSSTRKRKTYINRVMAEKNISDKMIVMQPGKPWVLSSTISSQHYERIFRSQPKLRLSGLIHYLDDPLAKPENAEKLSEDRQKNSGKYKLSVSQRIPLALF